MRSAVTMKIHGDMKGALRKLGGEDMTRALRSGVYAAAKVLYTDMLLRVPIHEGGLVDAIYHWHDDKLSTATRQVYRIGPNKAKAPHWHLVEYGHWRRNVVYRDKRTGRMIATRKRLEVPVWVPAYPYIRPTYDGMIGNAMSAAKIRLKQRVGEFMRGVRGSADPDIA